MFLKNGHPLKKRLVWIFDGDQMWHIFRNFNLQEYANEEFFGYQNTFWNVSTIVNFLTTVEEVVIQSKKEHSFNWRWLIIFPKTP